MTEQEEQIYLRGSESAYREMLVVAIRGLGYHGMTLERALLIISDTRAALRVICGRYGDNEWDENTYMADVIEQHLAWHLRLKEVP